MTTIHTPFNQRLVLLVGLTVLGLILCWVYFSPQTIVPTSQEQPSQVAAAMLVPVMKKFMPVEPMLPEPPTPAPTPKPTVATKPTRIDAGQALLAGKAMLKDGNTPKFIGQIDMPFADYLLAMEKLGCRLTGYDLATQRVVGYFQAGQLVRKSLAGEFSTQARDVTGDMPSTPREKYLTVLREKVGHGSYRLMLVIPSDVQDRFAGALAIMIKRAGFEPAHLDSVGYSFSKQGNNLVLHLDSVIYKNITSKTVEATAFGSIHGAS